MRIVPTGKAYPVEKIMEAMDSYIYVCGGKRQRRAIIHILLVGAGP